MESEGTCGGEALQRQGRPSGRLDGITKMSGSVTFASNGVSVDLNITEGSTANTSDFRAYGGRGNTVSSNATKHTASLADRGENQVPRYHMTASGLPTASTTENYAVEFKYKLRGVDQSLTGTVAKSEIVVDGSTAVSVSLTA